MLLSPALASDINESRDAHRFGGTLVWGTTSPPTDLNPVLTERGVSASLEELIFTSLFRIDSNGQAIPGVVQSWELSGDRKTYTFHLHQRVFFHDGVELSADDVKFTYDAIRDDRNKSPWKTLSVIDGQWQVRDRYTLSLSLKAPDDGVLFKLHNGILPRHLFKDGLIIDSYRNDHPVGSGPFQFLSWDKKSGRVELLANKNYFEGRPYLDRIVVQVYSDNTRMWAAMLRQEVDFVAYLNKDDYRVLQSDKTFRVYEIPFLATSIVAYDMKDPILADVRVRRAIALSVNVRRVLNGVATQGIPSTGPFQPGMPGFDPNVEEIAYDPKQAMALLSEAGWREKNASGMLVKDGATLEIRMLVDEKRDYYQRIAMMIRQHLSEAGIKLTVIHYRDERDLTAEYFSRVQPNAILRFVYSDGTSPMNILNAWYPSTDPLKGLWNYRSVEVDKLLAMVEGEPDPKGQMDVFRQIHRVMYKDMPACFLFSPAMFEAVSAKFGNVEQTFSPFMPMYTIKDWYLDK